MIALVLLVQVGLIFALGDRKAIVPRAASAAQQMQISATRSDLLALQDPTLFALPNARGFGAAAWSRAARLDFSVFRMPETKPAWYELSEAELGTTFHHFVETNVFASFALEARPPREDDPIALPPTGNPVVTNSSLQMAGELAKRALETRFELPSFPAADLLTNTVVQVLADSDGRIFSAVVLPAPGGSRLSDEQLAANSNALYFARRAQFAPLNSGRATRLEPSPELTRGAMIFKWHTDPLPATNHSSTP